MKKTQLILFFKIITSFIFLGRSWQHLFWNAPYRSFFWDEKLFSPVVETIFSTPWEVYATSLQTDLFIQNLIISIGVFYAIVGIVVLFITFDSHRIWKILLLIGGISLVILSVLTTKEKFYHLAQFFEHSIQFGTPVVLYLFLSNKIKFEKLQLIFKILIAVTFTSHGLYALGVYPVPGKFVDMTISILDVNETVAINFLFVVGLLDIFAAILLFFPKVAKVALIYCCIWGLLTAMARLTSDFYLETPFLSLHQNLYKVIFRLSHGLLPLLVYLILKNQKNSSKAAALNTVL